MSIVCSLQTVVACAVEFPCRSCLDFFFCFYCMPMYGKIYRSVSIVSTEFGDGWYLTDSNTPQSLKRVSGQTSAEYAGEKPQGRKTSSLRICCHMVDPPIEATMEAQYAVRSIYNQQDGLDPEYTCLSPLYSASCVKRLIWSASA